jgi:hypothetical protein
MNSPDTVASVLVNLSAIGFIIFFGIATIVPMVYGLSLSRKRESVELEFDQIFGFSYRLIKKIRSNGSVFVLTVISLLFIITGLLSLLYFLTECDSFLTAALFLSISSVFVLIVCISWMVLSAAVFAFIVKDEIAQIREYVAVAYEK